MTGTPRDGRSIGALDISKRSCARCVFAQEAAGVTVLNVGAFSCFRFPPSMMVLQGQTVSLYPLVNKNMWCGEFVERPAVS